MHARFIVAILVMASTLPSCNQRTAPATPTGPSTPPVTIAFDVVSEGFNIDNLEASAFLRNGQTFASSRTGELTRGFNVAAIDPRTGQQSGTIRRFDTWGTRDTGTAMRDLVAFLDSVPAGTPLLIAVHDEAGLTRDDLSCLPEPSPASVCCQSNGHAWTEEGVRALEALGAQGIRQYCYRNSYAFTAVKGGNLRAEQLTNRVPARARIALTIP
jgi:hypothetical protein